MEGEAFNWGMPWRWEVSQMATRRSESGYGRGFSKTPFRTLKIAVLAPIPMARVMRVMTANIGERARRRRMGFI